MTKPENAKDWIQEGLPCWYYPGAVTVPFAGVIGKVWEDEDRVLCVRLVELEERYVKRSGRAMVGRAPWYTLRRRRPK
jgi:hypothetical protein